MSVAAIAPAATNLPGTSLPDRRSVEERAVAEAPHRDADADGTLRHGEREAGIARDDLQHSPLLQHESPHAGRGARGGAVGELGAVARRVRDLPTRAGDGDEGVTREALAERVEHDVR